MNQESGRMKSTTPSLTFLNPGDPYHAYFQQKVADIKEQDGKGEIKRFCIIYTVVKEIL